MWWWEACWKKEKKHLQLACECKGGGSAKRRVETPKKKRLQLAFGREGSGGEDGLKRLKKSFQLAGHDRTGGMHVGRKKTPPARL